MILQHAASDFDGATVYVPEGHRATYADEVREAMAVLDRASEGQDFPLYVINRALFVTGDARGLLEAVA